MRVRFLIACSYASGNSDAREFKAGEVVDLRDDLAHRWLSRGAAEVAPEPQLLASEQPTPSSSDEGYGGPHGRARSKAKA